jgi:hypothetical protein
MGVRRSIAARFADEEPLANAPDTANIPNVGQVSLGQNSDIIRSAENYARESGIPLTSPIEYAKLDPKFARMYADYYERMRHNPNDPRTKQAYEALVKETEAQFEQMLSDGVNPYLFTNNDPYKNSPYEALGDLYQNKRLGIYSTRDGFGSDNEFDPTGNPLLKEMDFTVDGQRFLLNDAFRGVHDYYGHGKHGFGFRAGGEDNAFRAHSGMFSDLARQAIATETRGQNSLLNYGPDGERNRNASLADTVFSDQKTGLLPNLVSTHRTPIGDERRRRIDADGPDGLRGRLEGAVNEDGIVEAVHYANRPIDYLDPSRYGSGLSGSTVSERNMAASPDFYDRTFAGLKTRVRPYQKEQGIGSVPNEVQLPIEQVYDILKDPDNIKPAVYSEIPSSNPHGRYTELTKKIYDAGYSAVFQDTPMGKILAIVDPVKTGKTLAAIPVAALGTAAALAPQESQAGVKGSLFDMSNLDEVPLAANYLAYSENNKPSAISRFADGVLGGADLMANIGSALTAPFVQGVQHFNAMRSPTAEGRTPSLEALQAQKAELGQMLNYSPRTELGQQYSDGLKNMIGEGMRSVAPALQETHEGLYERENMNPYRTASDGLGALHEWYKSLDPKSRMHVDAGMDVSPY